MNRVLCINPVQSSRTGSLGQAAQALTTPTATGRRMEMINEISRHNARFRKEAGGVMVQELGGEAVLLDLQGERYYGLDSIRTEHVPGTGSIPAQSPKPVQGGKTGIRS